METGSEVGRGNLAQFYTGGASHETRLTLLVEAHQAASIRCDASPYRNDASQFISFYQLHHKDAF
jgi:hypothetical protein